MDNDLYLFIEWEIKEVQLKIRETAIVEDPSLLKIKNNPINLVQIDIIMELSTKVYKYLPLLLPQDNIILLKSTLEMMVSPSNQIEEEEKKMSRKTKFFKNSA